MTPHLKVFISYPREEHEIALKLYKDLKISGIAPWIDSKNLLPGVEWNVGIRQAIEDCSFFIALLSSDTISKVGFAQKERKIALEILENHPPNSIFIIPVRINECKAVDDKLSKLHYADLFPKYKHGFQQILKVLIPRQGLLSYPPSSKFGSRLFVSDQSKSVIADYCMKCNFWKSEDVVFIESGTLPVFMMLSLYRDIDNSPNRPNLFITNNIACSNIIMRNSEIEGDGFDEYPSDKPSKCILLGGVILDDYAATIPEDLFDESLKIKFWESTTIDKYFAMKKINHIIMMVSRLTFEEGPCAASLAMRRFKKLLLKYVIENEFVRLSILAEADKLCGRAGDPVDAINLQNCKEEKYWKKVLESGRLNFISAISPGMNPGQIERSRNEILKMQNSGAKCTLLSIDGKAIMTDA